jgi:SAM-dependent methyltransferase
VKSGFDRLAVIYDWLELLAFAGALRRSQTRLLPELPSCQRALVVGGGTGVFLEQLARQTTAHITCIELSQKMLDRSQARIVAQLPDAMPRIHFVRADVAEFASDAPFDLICTMCLLDCFDEPELERVMRQLSAQLAPDGCWLFHDFEPQGPIGRAVVWLLYRFFRLSVALSASRLPDMPAAFARHGFGEFASHWDIAGLVVSRLYQFGTGKAAQRAHSTAKHKSSLSSGLGEIPDRR